MPLRRLMSLFKRKKKSQSRRDDDTASKEDIARHKHHAGPTVHQQHGAGRSHPAGAQQHKPPQQSHHQPQRPAQHHGQHKPAQPTQTHRQGGQRRPAQQPQHGRPRPTQQVARQPVHQAPRSAAQHSARPQHVPHVPAPPVRAPHVPPAPAHLPRAPKPAPAGPSLRFDQLGLKPNLLEAVMEEGYSEPTPIQQQAIPVALAGRDILGCAQTGTGKTAAFALPILQKLDRAEVVSQRYHDIRALIVTPTRELAAQIGESFKAYGRHTKRKYAVIYGGVFQGVQVKAMYGGVDILVATPGRLLDLMRQRMVLLHKVEILVLDEADRMLDMGFINDIQRIVAKVPSRRQTLFFSATMPPEIRTLAGGILDDPVSIAVTPDVSAAETVDHVLYYVERDDKPELLRRLLADPGISRALVFTRTKVRADRVARKLTAWGIPASAIHGDKSQGARERTLAAFKSGESRVLVASDIVSRGIDIDDISHVINFDIPHEAEAYVHRIGRTGRAGATGRAISFCDRDERDDLRQIERLLGRAIPVVAGHHDGSAAPESRPAGGSSGGTGANRLRGQHGRSGNRRRRR